MPTTPQTAIRKRQQISQANRMMFLWVAGISVIVGFSIVGSAFLVQKLIFNERVLAEKAKTVSTLQKNNDAIADLKDNIRKLNSDQSLIDLKTGSEDKALQVVLDALPADANSPALGSSLQNKLISGIDGLTLQTLNVSPVAGVESSGDDSTVDASAPTDDTSADGSNQIDFTLTATGNANALKELLNRLELSIRAIDVTSLTLESQNGSLELSLTGRAFYQPPRTVELKDKVIKQ